MTRTYKPYTTKELKLIEQMAVGGVNRQEIANAVGRGYHTVCSLISSNGWNRKEFNYNPVQLGRIMMSIKNKQLSLELNKTAKQISQKRYELRLKLIKINHK